MSKPKLPPLEVHVESGRAHAAFTVDSVEARERILLARVAELDLALSIARQNAELLTGYWKAATAEAKALRAEMKAHGITPEGDDDADGW